MQDAGAKVSQMAVRIDGRLLPSPTLEFANQSAAISNGSWNLKQTRFVTPATLRIWMVVDFTLRQDALKRDQFAQTLGKSFDLLGSIPCRLSRITNIFLLRYEKLVEHLDSISCTNLSVHLAFSNPYMCSINGQSDISKASTNTVSKPNVFLIFQQNLRNHCQRAYNQASTQSRKAIPDRVELIIAILDPNQKPIRMAIKRFGDVEEGIPTQCIVSLSGLFAPPGLQHYTVRC